MTANMAEQVCEALENLGARVEHHGNVMVVEIAKADTNDDLAAEFASAHLDAITANLESLSVDDRSGSVTECNLSADLLESLTEDDGSKDESNDSELLDDGKKALPHFEKTKKPDDDDDDDDFLNSQDFHF
jgi:hypothetical protein